MKAYNHKRTFVEFATIQRIAAEGSLGSLATFGNDLFARMLNAQNRGYTCEDRDHKWVLGNVEADQDRSQISAQVGWEVEVADDEAVPPFDPETHEWGDEAPSVRTGALALFAIDTASQRVAITRKAGDIQTKAVCRALNQMLGLSEHDAKLAEPLRPDIDWRVAPLIESGVFQTWLERVDRVSRIHVTYHLPNPEVLSDIASIVEELNGATATDGEIVMSNSQGAGLTPEGSPLLQAAIAMEQHNYGTITAAGEREGRDDPFKSVDHIANDKLQGDGVNRPSATELVAQLFDLLADWVRRAGR